jgi:hypothetical protein
MDKAEHEEYLGKDESAHLEVSGPRVDVPSNPFDYESLSYGASGLKGIISSPFVLGAAALASLGGFSFGYGTWSEFYDQGQPSDFPTQIRESFRLYLS